MDEFSGSSPKGAASDYQSYGWQAVVMFCTNAPHY